MQKAQWLETTDPVDQPGGNPCKLIIVIPSCLPERSPVEATVYGYGCEDYFIRLRWVIPALEETVEKSNSPESIISGFKPTKDFWGEALIWAKPRTVARLIAEVIYSQ